MAPSQASSKASTSTSNAICYKCGGKGHKSFECINTKVMLTDENGDTHSMSEGEYEALQQVAITKQAATTDAQERISLALY